MRILYLAQFFEPEPMIKGASFVRALIAQGHEVEVVTGFPNYPLGRLYSGYRLSFHQVETIGDVLVHRVPLYPSHGRSSMGRTLNYLSYVVSATVYGIFAAKRFDVIYSYPPPTVGIAAAIIGWVRRRPFVLDIQDLWPDSVVKSGMRGTGRMERVLNAMCNFLYRRAARIVAQSRGIAARLAERGVPAEKIDVIFNWADEDAARPRSTCDLTRFGFEGRFNVVYGGNLGRMQGLDALIRAAHLAARQVPNLQLLLIGNGVESENLRALKALGTTNVLIEPGVPRNEIGDIFAGADVLALHLIDDPLFEITIPQKTQFYMAMGKPILIGVRGEAARCVVDHGAGLAAEPENVDSLAEVMVRFARMSRQELGEMGARGRESYERFFAFGRAMALTEATLYVAAGKGLGKSKHA